MKARRNEEFFRRFGKILGAAVALICASSCATLSNTSDRESIANASLRKIAEGEIHRRFPHEKLDEMIFNVADAGGSWRVTFEPMTPKGMNVTVIGGGVVVIIRKADHRILESYLEQ